MRIATRKLLMYVCVSALIISVGAQRVRVIDNKGTITEVDPSKWEQKDNDIYNKNSGNVGIGTNVPQAKLHNAGSTILGSVDLTSGSIDAATVDSYSGVVVKNNTTGTITIAEPTDKTAGRIFQVSNSNTSAPITVGGVTLAPGNSTLFRWDGGAWSALAAASVATAANDWHLAGNSGTTPGTGAGQSFLGTTDDKELVFGTDGKERMRLFSYDSNEALGLGVTSVPGGISAWSGSSLFLGNTGNIVSSTGLDVIIDADKTSTNSTFRIRANGDGADAVDLVNVEESGNVGIGNTNPSYKLDVAGDVNLTGALRVGATAAPGTSGQILQSNGAAAPSWVSPNSTLTKASITSSTTGVTITGTNNVLSAGTIDIATASGTQQGLLSAANWTTFNSKEPAISTGTTSQYWRGDKTWQTLALSILSDATITTPASNQLLQYNGTKWVNWTPNYIGLSSLSGAAPIIYNNATGSIGITKATNATDGYLTSTDWTTFNNKVSSIAAGSTKITIGGTATAPTVDVNTANLGTIGLSTGTTGTDVNVSGSPANLGGSLTLNIPTASATNRGALASADWTSFNSKIGSVTATTPAAVSTSGATATIQNTGAYWNANQVNSASVPVSASYLGTNASGQLVSVSLPSTVTSFKTTLSGLTPTTATTGVVSLDGTLGISNGGTGATTANAALNNLLPSQASNAGKVLTTDGTNASWVASGSSNAWNISGNAGTNANTHFVGTTDWQDLVFKINGTESGRLGVASHSTSFGYSSAASGADAVAVGSSASATSLEGIAIGKGTIAQTNKRTIAIGSGASSTAEDGIAIGTSAKVESSIQSIAIGNQANATSQYGIAIGAISNANTQFQAIAIGYGSNASSRDGIAIGTSAKATTNNQTIAMGLEAEATSLQSIAIGALTKAITNDEATAVGYNTLASGWKSTALGSKANATAPNATAIGSGALANQANTIILGNGANVGIGLSNPTYKLDVTGDINLTGALRINGNNGSNGQVLQSNGTVASWVTPTYLTSAVTTFSGGTTGLTPSSATSGVVTLGGTLGIANGGTGATTANAALNNLLPSQASNAGKVLTTDGTNASWVASTSSTGWLLGGNSISSGQFLGTTNNEDLVFRTNNTESGRTSVYQLSTAFGISAIAAFEGVAFGDHATAAQGGTVLGRSSTTGYQSTALGYKASAMGQSAIAVGDNASAAGYQSTAIGSGSSASAQNATAIGNGAIANTANTVILGNGANVGIGLSNPSYKLDVAGDVNLTGALRISGNAGSNGQILTSNGTAAPTWATYTSANTPNIYTADGTLAASRTVNQDGKTLSFTNASTTNAFSVAGSTFSVDGQNNRVGIGTSTPNYTLSVGGNKTGIDGSDGTVYMQGTKNTNRGIEWNYGASDRYGIAQANGGNMAIYTAGSYPQSFISFNLANDVASSFTELMRISHNGNVGIGYSNPQSPTSTSNPNTPTPGSSTTLAVNGIVDAPIYTSPVQGSFTSTGANGTSYTGASLTWDLSKGSSASWTLNAGANTLTLSNVKAGMYGVIVVKNAGTSTLTFASGTNKVINGGGGVPTLTQAAGAFDILSFFYDGTTYWWTIGNNYN